MSKLRNFETRFQARDLDLQSEHISTRFEAEVEVEAQPTRLGMLRLMLRPINVASRKLEVALEFSCT